EPKLLHATIRENLTLGLDEPLSQESLFNTLRQVGLDDWLTRINHDLDAVVSEQANQFSGGEKQRFAIARAMLRQAKIILLDEPTSALDKQKKSALMTLIRELATDRRIIMICHDLELINDDDEVIEITNGRISN
ncbi:MAG: ATP-binding cassette domain-containing protein, partial [Psychrobium sp.]